MRSVLTSILGVLFALAALGPATGLAAADPPPGTITIDSLAVLFEGVIFDHGMHVDMTDDCSACHHHTTGTPPEPQCASCHQGRQSDVVACRSCHPAQSFSAAYLREKEEDAGRYHTDKPGLKAAYHRNCLGCHEEVGGPMGCEDCHARTETGDAFYHTGSHAPAPQPAAEHAH